MKKKETEKEPAREVEIFFVKESGKDRVKVKQREKERLEWRERERKRKKVVKQK